MPGQNLEKELFTEGMSKFSKKESSTTPFKDNTDMLSKTTVIFQPIGEKYQAELEPIRSKDPTKNNLK